VGDSNAGLTEEARENARKGRVPVFGRGGDDLVDELYG
jgi:hypothetical protein